MDKHLDLLLTVVEELEACKEVTILNFELYPGLAPDYFPEIEKSIGFPLPLSFVRFFSESNGFQLYWVHENDPDHLHSSPQVSLPFPFDEPLQHHWFGTGCINILPLEKLLLENWTWLLGSEGINDEIEFDQARYSYSNFYSRISPLDLFSKYESMIAFLDKKHKEIKLSLAVDQFADYTVSKITDFDSYLRFLVYSKGIVKERFHFYHDIESTRVTTNEHFWQQQPPLSLKDYFSKNF